MDEVLDEVLEFTPSGATSALGAAASTAPGDSLGGDTSAGPSPPELLEAGDALHPGRLPVAEKPHEEPSVSTLQAPAVSLLRSPGALQEHDDSLPLDDDEARLLGLRHRQSLWRPWGRG